MVLGFLASCAQHVSGHRIIAAAALLMLGKMLPIAPVAAQSCASNPCTITAPTGGSFGTAGTIAANPAGGSLTLTNQAPFGVSYAGGVPFVLDAYSLGTSGALNTNAAGQPTGAVTVTNTGTLTMVSGVDLPAGIVGTGLRIQTNGGEGAGASTAQFNAGAGGAAGAITVTNGAAISLQPNFYGGMLGIAAAAGGGAGGSVAASGTNSSTGLPAYSGSNGNGGNGGSAGVVSVTNSGVVSTGNGGTTGFYTSTPPAGDGSLYVFENLGFRGLSATSVGGVAGAGVGASGAACTSSGAGCGGGAIGGSGGNATIVSTGNVTIFWNWATASGPNTAVLPTNVGFGVFAASAGAAGQQTVTTDYSGGAGGAAGTASVTLNQGGSVLVAVGNTGPLIIGTKYPALTGAGAGAYSLGGAGGQPYGASHPIGSNPVIAGGTGGQSSEAIISVNNATVSVQGNQMAGAVSISRGGDGGSGNWSTQVTTPQGGSDSNGGTGGAAGVANVGIDTATIATSGQGAPAALVISQGGAGGTGATYFDNAGGDGGNGGPAGAGGNVLASWYKGSVTTVGDNSPALFAGSYGGNGGTGGDRPNGGSGDAGGGGTAGGAGGVTVQLQLTSITTTGDNAPGVVALSVGGLGGSGGNANPDGAGSPRPGGAGGASGLVTVTLDSGSSISTAGAASSAVIASSLSGAGGMGNNNSNIFSSQSGPGGAGGNAGTNGVAITIANAGLIKTAGLASMGILAQAASGGGGAGGTAGGIFAQAGTGSSAGSIGSVTVTNSGTITTGGTTAHAILAQSIGGGGGNGGSLDYANSGIGGTSGLAAAGAAVSITNTGGISTAGGGSIGVLAQSIGGGGGNGGNAEGLFSIGGQGTGGGNGGSVTFSQTAGTILTTGTQAHALVAQSTGGGGGNGGNATSVSVGATLAIGGTGAGGGSGGPVSVTASGGSIIAQGTKASGIVAQSVGGGGGTGGAAYSSVVGALLSAGVSVGGAGGGGGAPSAVTIELTNTTIVTGAMPALVDGTYGTTVPATNRLPVDAFGIVAQALGGGGGMGGSAIANALTAAVPIVGTETNWAVTVDVSVGGSGGTAGDVPTTSPVNVTLHGGTSVTTYGMGGHAIMAQSIGGGGGEGGDSSSYAAAVAYGRSASLGDSTQMGLSVAVGVGGSSSAGGAGGSVTVTHGDTSGATASITTLGDFANGILAQSVGGGGGNGGTGAASSYYAGGDTTLTTSVAVGSKGSAGGGGGTVQVTVTPLGTITTYGDGANALVAQSIGGGGGTSQGTTVNVTAAYLKEVKDQPGVSSYQPSASVTMNVGSTGAGGGDGGAVTVTNAGKISTQGGDSAGILAQSVGGGGGLGGAAGGQASADNPISGVTLLRTFVSNIILENVPANASLTASVGSAAGGNAGNGGTVNVTHSGSIITQGDWANGIFAQSVGGGGGRAGTAVTSGSGPAQISLSLGSLMGGNGGSTTISLQGGTIATGATRQGVVGGFAAFGIVGQSIGSGGGLLADNSDVANGSVLAPDGVTLVTSTINVGPTTSGVGGAPGSGGTVTLSGNGTITTLGEAAHAIVLQSIGGSGGIAGAGTARFQPTQVGTGVISVSVGGNPVNNGFGGSVTVNNALLNVATSGINAFGLLAQSIGGGGGLAFVQQGVPATYMLGGRTGQFAVTNNGGAVNVALADNSRIVTSGAGSIGIMAQSIGGGGGIAGYGVGATTLARASTANGPGLSSTGDGGAVSITTGNSVISTSGASAHGIVAQSVGGGGGMTVSADGTTVYLGSTGTIATNAGSISVVQAGTVSATGANAFGIIAQSVSPVAAQSGGISLQVNGSVTGGSGQGGGVAVDSGNNNYVGIGPDGLVTAASGLAIRYTGGSTLDVTNYGTVVGNLDNVHSFLNENAWTPGTASSAAVINRGRIVLLSFARPTLVGRLTQEPSGTMLVAADFNSRRAGSLAVQGDAVLAGSVTPVITSVLPNIAIPVLTVSGAISGGLAGTPSALFGYGVARSGNQLLLSATSANFAPASFGLPESRAATAGHLQDAWNNGGTPALGTLFALLGNTAQASPSAYSAQLRQISPDAAIAPGGRLTNDTLSFATNAMSCPTFEGTTAMLIETQCAWLRVTGRTTGQDPGNGITNYRLGQVTTQIGGQKEIGGGWLLGGSLAYTSSRLSSDDSLTSGNGQGGYGAVTAKYQTGPWLLAAAAYGGAGQFNTSRVITIPGFSAVAKGNPDTASVGVLFRANYTVGTEHLYVRPNVTVGAVHARTGAYQESGAGALNLGMDSASRSTLVLTPMLEIGGRVELGDGMLMRPFVAAGVALFSNGAWQQNGRLVSAPSGTGTFTTNVPTDQVAARVGAGVQISSGPFDLRLQYDGEFSKTVASNAGSLIGAWRF